MGMLIRMKGGFQLLALLGEKSKIKVIYKKCWKGFMQPGAFAKGQISSTNAVPCRPFS